jgi:hypothetical protein
MLMKLAAVDAPSPAGTIPDAGMPPTPEVASAELNRLIGLSYPIHPIAPACVNGGQEFEEKVMHAAMKLITLHSGGRFMALNPAMAACLITSNFSRGIHAARNAGQPMTIFCPIRAAKDNHWILAVVESTSKETRLLDIIDTGGTPMFYLKEAVDYINRLGLPPLNTAAIVNRQHIAIKHTCHSHGSGGYIIAWAASTVSGRIPQNDVLAGIRGAMWLQVVKWMLSPDDESPENIVVSGFTGSLCIQEVVKSLSRLEQMKYLQALSAIQLDTMYASDVMGCLADAAEKMMKQYAGVIEAVDQTRAMKQWFELGETLGYMSPILKREFDMVVANKVKLAQSLSPEPEYSNPLHVFALVDGAKRLRYAWSKLRAEVEKVNGVLKWARDEEEKENRLQRMIAS